jgi:type I pantothenate kinase
VEVLDDEVEAAEVVRQLVVERDARLVGVTGAVAVGKSTLAGAVAGRVGAAVVASDGFLLSNAVLAERDLTHRKGFPESFDAGALAAALDAWNATGAVDVPVYSHLAYDVVPPPRRVVADRLVVEGLHLGHPMLGVRDRFDVLVHLDAADDELARWYLDRFRALRAEAAADPDAFLHQFRDVPAEVIEGMAMDVWQTLNQVVIDDDIRPWASVADLVIHFGPAHEVEALVWH